MPAYCYETSGDLINWVSAEGVEETVLSRQEINGVMIENMDAAIRGPSPKNGSIRLRWNP